MQLTKLELFASKPSPTGSKSGSTGADCHYRPERKRQSNNAERFAGFSASSPQKACAARKWRTSSSPAPGAQAYGLCEVQRTLDNSDRLLPVDYSEVQIQEGSTAPAKESISSTRPLPLKGYRVLFRHSIGREGYTTNVRAGRRHPLHRSETAARFSRNPQASQIPRPQRRSGKKAVRHPCQLLRIGDIVDGFIAPRPAFEQRKSAPSSSQE
jgi:hypothetical protein